MADTATIALTAEKFPIRDGVLGDPSLLALLADTMQESLQIHLDENGNVSSVDASEQDLRGISQVLAGEGMVPLIESDPISEIIRAFRAFPITIQHIRNGELVNTEIPSGLQTLLPPNLEHFIFNPQLISMLLQSGVDLNTLNFGPKGGTHIQGMAGPVVKSFDFVYEDAYSALPDDLQKVWKELHAIYIQLFNGEIDASIIYKGEDPEIGHILIRLKENFEEQISKHPFLGPIFVQAKLKGQSLKQ